MKEMEKLPEGRLQFPAHWKFPEKEMIGNGIFEAKIIQVEQFFLALKEAILCDRKEYRFDGKGNVVSEKTVWNPGPEPVIDIRNKDGEIASHFYTKGANGSSTSLSIFSFDSVKEDGEIDQANNFGYAQFAGGKLTSIVLRKLFDIDMEGNKIISPECILTFDENGKPKIDIASPYIDPTKTIDGDGPYKFGSNGELYILTWGINDNGNYYFAQTQDSTGIKKVLEAPIELDLAKLREAVLTEPLYEKQKIGGRESLKIPWRDIDKTLGVTLSYSHAVSQDLLEEKTETEGDRV